MHRGLLIPALVLGAGCNPVEEIRERFFDGPTPRARYAQKLEWAGLQNTALAADWLAAGESALLDPVTIRAPHAEETFLPPERPSALGYLLSVRRGQVVSIDVGLKSDSTALLFIDVHRVVEDTVNPFRHEESADSAARELLFEPRRDGQYIVRVQPELLRGGRLSVRIRVDATLAFPVQSGTPRDIGSVFGDPRDGGSRSHHGVDIFARRGTPALAPTGARVSRVQTTPIGGKVVWLRDERRGQSLYYAHLDSQYVTRGQRLQTGDTVGFIGNTGNARTTPPHLHFGIYSRGPVDPYPFINPVRERAATLAADTSRIGGWMRTAGNSIRVRSMPDPGTEAVVELERHTPLHVLAATGTWYRVRLPDRSWGYVPAGGTEYADNPVDVAVLAERSATHVQPDSATDVVDEIDSGDTVEVIGQFREYLLVRSPTGMQAWLPRQE